MERLLVETNNTTINAMNNYSSKSSSSDIITNTSSSSNSLTFTDDDDLSSSSGSTLANNHTKINDMHKQQYSILRVAAPIVPLRSNQNSSSSSSSSTSSSCSAEIQPKQEISKSTTTTKFIFILNAFVNGFAQLKLCADKIDYEYIIELYWSNEDRSFVKRTYDDFVTFHRNLIQTFSQFFNEINSNNQNNYSSSNSNKNSNRHSRLFFNNFDEYLMPILPASKKPFWISHLKLAESREIELNSYVQRILKLPTQISHSELVLKFFESQSSDPKPARYCMHLDISIDNRFYDDLDTTNSNATINAIASSTTNLTNNTNESDIESNSNYEDDDAEEDDDYDDSNSTNNYPSYLDISNSNNQLILSGNQLNGNLRKKKSNREAGLWWDEDEALNELTSSMSFDFTNHLNQNNQNGDEEEEEELEEDNYYENDEKDDLESVTMKRLERILQNSELFGNDLKENVTSSTILLSKNDKQLLQQLQLS